MHRAQQLVDSRLSVMSIPKPHLSFMLNGSDHLALEAALTHDAADYFHSGIVSLGDALRSIEAGLYTWATVKLYYSVFYCCRALLADKHTAILYFGNTPYQLKNMVGGIPQKLNGTTHKVVLALFAQQFSGNLLVSHQIDSIAPFDWMTDLREQANYKLSRFVEPDIPTHFKTLAKIGVRKAIGAYVTDKTYMYAFDRDHAALAFPLLTLVQTISSLGTASIVAVKNRTDKSFLQKLLADKQGPFTDLLRFTTW